MAVMTIGIVAGKPSGPQPGDTTDQCTMCGNDTALSPKGVAMREQGCIVMCFPCAKATVESARIAGIPTTERFMKDVSPEWAPLMEIGGSKPN